MAWHETRVRSRRSAGAAVSGMVLALALSFVPAGAHAEPGAQKDSAAQSSGQLIRETINVVFALLRDPVLKQDTKQRMRKLREAVDRAFDWEAMAQSSLGPSWRKLDDKQRKEFVSVFKELLAQEYMDDIDRFQGTEQVQVKGRDKSGELEIVKTTLITASREQVPMDYTLQQAGPRWMVIDLSVEGVSLVNHYRQTFSRFLANKPFADLMQQLKRKLGIHE
jgi:phospholipid transport system substrate-binding protein